MHVFTELLTCSLPRNTSPARLYLNSRPLSSCKQMAIFLNQLCREIFPSPNKQVFSLPIPSYSGPKPMTTSSCCTLRPSRARHKCWHSMTAMSVAKYSSRFTWTKLLLLERFSVRCWGELYLQPLMRIQTISCGLGKFLHKENIA